MKTAILAAMLGSAAAFAPAQQVRDTPDCTFSADLMILWESAATRWCGNRSKSCNKIYRSSVPVVVSNIPELGVFFTMIPHGV